MAQTHYAYARELRDPATAALLSMIPGLGQFYNGESRKGILFLDVAIINYFLLALVLLAPGVAKLLQDFGKQFDLKVNQGLLNALKDMHIGSPVSLIVIGMVIAFIAYAVRDAYDHAMVRRRRALYSDSVVELTEATSGSYIMHASIILALAITAVFFILPKAPEKQITEIEFVNNIIKPVVPVPRVKDNVRSQEASLARIRKFDATRPIQKVPPKSELAKSESQNKAQTRTEQSQQAASASSQAKSLPLPQPKQVVTPAAALARTAPVPPQVKPVLLAQAPKLPSMPALNPVRPPMPAQSTNLKPAPFAPPSISSNQAMMPKAISASSNPLPMPIVSPVQALPTSLPSMMPAGSLPNHGKTSVMPSSTGVGSTITNAFQLPGHSSMPILNGGGKIASPLQGGPRGNTSGSTILSGPPGPVAIDRAVGGPAGVVPQAGMLGSGPDGRGRRRGPDGEGDSDVPRPVGAKGLKAGDGPISVMPSGTGRPQSGPGDKELNMPAAPGKDSTGAAKDADFGPYMAELQRKIKRNWSPSRESQSRRVKVLFKIHTNGEMSNLRLVQSSGVAVVDQAAIKAVEQSAPFRHLPENSPESVDIEFSFDYNVFSGRTF